MPIELNSGDMTEDELLKKYNGLYLEIIMRYKEAIEKGEKLYMAELPKLITPSDENVVSIVNRIKGSFQGYNYDQNFYDAAKQANAYIKDSIKTISSPIQFWLRPNQVISLEAGDVFDKMVLLCSMLIALGNASTKIITVVVNDSKKHAVYCEFGGKIVAIDAEGLVSEFDNKEALFERMGVKKESEIDAYEFNDKMYNDLA